MTPTESARQEHRKFTGDEVLRMVEAGILREDEPLELLEGELVVMSPQGPVHRSTNVRLHRALSRVYEPAAHVQVKSPVEAGPHDLLREGGGAAEGEELACRSGRALGSVDDAVSSGSGGSS